MKIISKSFLLSSAVSLVLPQATFASLSSGYTSLVDTSQNQAFESRPPLSLKLAAVHFITNDGGLNFGGNNPGNQEFSSSDLCKISGYLYEGCPAGYVPGEACPEDNFLVKECIDPDIWCKDNGYTVTSCTLPKYLSDKCPHSDTLYKSCEDDNPRACKDAGYAADCEAGKVKDEVCPYDSSFGKCICNPCAGFTYTSAEASAQGYVPGEVCNSCGTMKYKRSEASCDVFKTCDCGGATGAKTCWSGTTKKFDTCKECCDTSLYQYDSSNCTGGKQLAGNSCGGKYESCIKPLQYLYSDKTLSTEIIPGKNIIGIAVDPENRLAVATDFIIGKTWGGYGTDIPTLENIDNVCMFFGGVDPEDRDKYLVRDGKANTAKIIAYGQASGISYPLAEEAYNYQPESCSSGSWCGQGNWYLPSIWQSFPYYANKETIEAMLKAINKLPDSWLFADRAFFTQTSNEISANESGLMYFYTVAIAWGNKQSDQIVGLIYITY